MTQRRRRYRRQIRWDRIGLALLLLAALLFGLVKGIGALVRHAKSNAASSEPASSSSGEPEPIAPVQPTVDLSQWNLILVNADHPLPEDYTVTTATLTNGLQVDARILDDLDDMVKTARQQGVELLICSAYRDIAYQTGLYQKKVAEYLAAGESQQSAEAKAGTVVALPGTSEHNTGLAVDIVTPEYQMLDDGYAETDAGQWLAAHAPEFGFILRYPNGKGDYTGIIFEPWHYRYVGRDYARTITDSGLCLEEWVASQQSAAAAPAADSSAASDPSSQAAADSSQP